MDRVGSNRGDLKVGEVGVLIRSVVEERNEER